MGWLYFSSNDGKNWRFNSTFKNYGKWDTLLSMLRKFDDDYIIQWCMEFDTYAKCEALFDDYLDY